MQKEIQAHFAKLQDALRLTTLGPDRIQAIAKSVALLPPLYQQFRLTNENRYGLELTRLVQSILRSLQDCPRGCELEVEFRTGLRNLHEELGIPALTLKAPPPPPRARATRSRSSTSA